MFKFSTGYNLTIITGGRHMVPLTQKDMDKMGDSLVKVEVKK